MKTIFLGDTHGRSFWKLAVNQEDPDRVVFIGDYFDSYDIKTEEQVNNFLDIMEYKKTSGKEVICLIGNHDIHYMIGETGTSGYQRIGRLLIEPVLEKYKDDLQICYRMDEIVCTHAGISSDYMDETFGKEGWSVENIENDLNELWKYKPKSFEFNGLDPYGNNIYQTPIWIRPESLMWVNKKTLKNKIIQIVGHTQMRMIDIKAKATGGRYYFIDTLATSGEYLIYENNKFKTGKI